MAVPLGKPLEKYTVIQAGEAIRKMLQASDKRTIDQLKKITALTEAEEKWAEAMRVQEEEYFRKFGEVVARSNGFFNLTHVDALRLPYDLLFFVAKKNIGKTRMIYRMMEESIARGEKFIYLRLSKDELTKAADAFNNDSCSPVYMVLDKQTFKFFDKRLINEVLEMTNGENESILRKQVSIKWLKDSGIDIVGYGYEFQFCQSYTGGQYENFTKIFYDECLSYNPRNVVNEKHLANWGAFLSSIARCKADLKIYLFGNLRDTNAILLDFYGIKRDDNLRYIVRGGDEKTGCRILYINAGELYRGIESQNRAVHHAGGAIGYQLENNEYLITSLRLLPPKAFDLYSPIVRFVYIKWIIEIKNFQFSQGLSKNDSWAVSAKPLTGFEDTTNSPIYSDDLVLCDRYHILTAVKSINPFCKLLHKAALAKCLRYLDEATIEIIEAIILGDPLRLKDPKPLYKTF